MCCCLAMCALLAPLTIIIYSGSERVITYSVMYYLFLLFKRSNLLIFHLPESQLKSQNPPLIVEENYPFDFLAFLYFSSANLS